MLWCHLTEVERTVRSLTALPIIAWGYYLRDVRPEWSHWVFWGGMYLALTAVITWCPLRGLGRLLTRGRGAASSEN